MPPTIYGSPRWYAKEFQDAMALVRIKGKPDFFLTVTCNTNWPEIKGSIFEGHQNRQRPDITARVFHMKVNALLADLLKYDILGRMWMHLWWSKKLRRGIFLIYICSSPWCQATNPGLPLILIALCLQSGTSSEPELDSSLAVSPVAELTICEHTFTDVFGSTLTASVSASKAEKEGSRCAWGRRGAHARHPWNSLENGNWITTRVHFGVLQVLRSPDAHAPAALAHPVWVGHGKPALQVFTTWKLTERT